ncbi:MAG: hypothetical protein DWQ36_03085 [Acidobacteria bacterium]|nr:MAG: hypothetical protein DWQ30_02320 [Acidobacteriota bacterium]REK11104.1 MAG: hypothetical protein DWQ36_03085 [Acidobacteriota bacterium]
MKTHHIVMALLSGLLIATGAAIAAGSDEIPRTADGKPDLSGTYDIATLTPLQRPPQYGDNLYLTPEEAERIEREEQEFLALGAAKSDPDRGAPEEGGAPPVGLGEEERETLGAGNVGGYNNFWIDRGDSVVIVDGKFRTSIITEPANGRYPPFTADAMKALGGLRDLMRPNDGTAYWIDWDRPGPYDNMEQRPLAERCLASFASTIPATPALYNNFKRIVQTPDRVMILNEMVHDVRIVRLNSEHPPADMKFWMGDSIGWWEGDTLVVETTNFKEEPGGFGFGSLENHKVTERFTRQDADTLHYAFEVENPDRWQSAWKGDYTWPRTDDKLFEYACHEGNYAMGNIMRGARLLEQDALDAKEGESK